MIIYSGQVWERKWPDCRRFLVVFVNGDKYVLMALDKHTDKKLAAPGFQHRKDGTYLFTQVEVLEYLEGGELCDLRCEFVDNKEAYAG